MRPGEGEVFIDLVRQEPQIVLPAQRGNAGDLVGGEYGTGRIMRAVDPDDARSWRHRAGETVEVGVKTFLGAQRHIHHARTARPDDTGIGTIDRLRQDHLIAGSGEAVDRAKKPALGSGCQDDIVGAARLAGASMHPLSDSRADLRIADDRRIAGAVAPQCLDRRVEDGCGGCLVGIADSQKDHLVTGLAAAHSFRVNVPGPGLFARDAVDKWRETHNASWSVADSRSGRPGSLTP